MKKILLPLVLIVFINYLLTYDKLDDRKTPAYHSRAKNGEIILRKKKARWIYNCMDCHNDFTTRTIPREMISDHADLNYSHIKGEKWCFSCHYEDLVRRNRIKLPPGKGIYKDTSDMIKLCRQCHGKKTHQWEINIHGKVSGSWKTWGKAKIHKKTCGNCHDPHHPRSPKVKPRPGPKLRIVRGGK